MSADEFLTLAGQTEVLDGSTDDVQEVVMHIGNEANIKIMYDVGNDTVTLSSPAQKTVNAQAVGHDKEAIDMAIDHLGDELGQLLSSLGMPDRKQVGNPRISKFLDIAAELIRQALYYAKNGRVE